MVEGIQRIQRPSLDTVLMRSAYLWCDRGTCERRQCGCVIATPDGHIIATGYNGAPKGLPHCTDVGCLIEESRCIRAVHAEVNAIIQAARLGTAIDGAIAYCTTHPCYECCKALINVGITHIVYDKAYDSWGADFTHELFRKAGVLVTQWTPDED